MCEDAIDCYIRCNNIKLAIDCCILLNQWYLAINLSEKYNYPQINSLLNKYINELINNNQSLLAVELYRYANKPTEAAILINNIANNYAKNELKPLFAKKLSILAALEIERHRKHATDLLIQQTTTQTAGQTNIQIAQTTAATLETLMMSSLDTQVTGGGANGTTSTNNNKKAAKAFGSAWRSASAYHYYMLAQKQFYES